MLFFFFVLFFFVFFVVFLCFFFFQAEDGIRDRLVTGVQTCALPILDITMTHFRPCEIGMTIAAAHKLGYTHDVFGEALTDANQTCELRVQDVVLPQNCADKIGRASCRERV